MIQYIITDFVILVAAILIPLGLVSLNQTSACQHHFEESGGGLWILGRALGFTTLIFLVTTLYKGGTMKKIAQKFKSYQKAKNYHCFSALLTNVIFLTHVLVLLSSDPWGPLVLGNEYAHLPFGLFLTKLLTGVLFGVVLVGVTVLFFYLRNTERFSKFGYQRFIRVHQTMLALTAILAIHVFLINTEIMVLFWG